MRVVLTAVAAVCLLGLALAGFTAVSLCEAFSGNVAGCWPHL